MKGPAEGMSTPPPVLITGGAGFVGCNLAHRLCSAGRPVVIYDNLSRAGVERNAAWLCETHGGLVRVEVEDVRDAERQPEGLHPVRVLVQQEPEVGRGPVRGRDAEEHGAAP